MTLCGTSWSTYAGRENGTSLFIQEEGGVEHAARTLFGVKVGKHLNLEQIEETGNLYAGGHIMRL